MPISTAPYKRQYQHSKKRGHEGTVACGSCGKMVPRWKTFVTYRGFRITDPTILKQIDRRMLHLMGGQTRVCPGCARSQHIVNKGRSVRKKHMNQ